jgi:phosphate transport system permease protein
MTNGISMFSAVVGLFFLGWILWVVAKRGAGALNYDFLFHRKGPSGEPGAGMGNAILGTVMMTGLGALMGVPAGMLAGVYMSEYGLKSRFGAAARFAVNMMMGIPSIIVGLFIYTILVKPFHGFSGYAGAVALAFLILPVVSRTTEDMLRLVPNELRESGLALGLPRWRITLNIVFRSAKAGLITGVLLAVARVSGETAPLLFTALNSDFWPVRFDDGLIPHSLAEVPLKLHEPTASLTVTMFNYAMSPDAEWIQKAWGASLLIMAGVLSTTILARLTVRERR